MSDPKDKNSGPPKAEDDRSLYDDEVGEQDDEVIGRALSKSLYLLVGMAVLALAVVLWRSQKVEVAPEQDISAGAPSRTEDAAQAPEVAFTDITEAAGIHFRHHNGAEGDRFLPETMGGGVAFFDYDNDDDQDLLLVDSDRWKAGSTARGQTRLYANDGTGAFSDVSEEVGLSQSFYGTGVAVGDYDNDGWTDIFVAAVGSNHLFRNEGGNVTSGRTFVDVSTSAGVSGGQEEWSTSSAFFDYDNDGDLDLFVGNYVRWNSEIDLEVDYRLTGVGRAYGPPVNYGGTFPYLYQNDGDGRFSDVSQAAGVRITNPATGEAVAKSLGVLPMDMDGDGWIDLFVSNDTVRNFFFHNQAGAGFEETGELNGLAYGRDGNATGAMGVDAAFFRNDREIAVGIGNFANEMTSFYVSQGEGSLFTDQAIGEGIGAPSRASLTFGLTFLDYDLDGRLDLLQVNGHLEEEINSVDPSQEYRQQSQIFWNAGNEASRTYVAVEPVGALAQKLVARASSYADIDGDGDLDFVITQTGDRAVLVRNDQSLGRHWLRVKLVGNGTTSNRNAIGAWIDLQVSGVTQRRQVMPTRGYQSQVELPITFGLGETGQVEALEVVWPDGEKQAVEVVQVDRLLIIEQR